MLPEVSPPVVLKCPDSQHSSFVAAAAAQAWAMAATYQHDKWRRSWKCCLQRLTLSQLSGQQRTTWNDVVGQDLHAAAQNISYSVTVPVANAIMAA